MEVLISSVAYRLQDLAHHVNKGAETIRENVSLGHICGRKYTFNVDVIDFMLNEYSMSKWSIRI